MNTRPTSETELNNCLTKLLKYLTHAERNFLQRVILYFEKYCHYLSINCVHVYSFYSCSVLSVVLERNFYLPWHVLRMNK